MTSPDIQRPDEVSPHARSIVDRFARDGFAVVPGLFPPEEVGAIRNALDGLFDDYNQLPQGHGYDLDRRPADGGLGKIPAIRDTLRLRPQLREARGLGAAVALAERLLGPGVEVLWDAAVYKPAGSTSETPWHQDEAVYHLSRLRKPRSLVYFWVALDEVGEANGCIRFVPGSQRGPLLPHVWRHGDPSSSLVVEAAVEALEAQAVPLAPGDATIHHPRILHSSGPNLSDRSRKAWLLGIGQPSSPRWLRRLKGRLLAMGGRSRGD